MNHGKINLRQLFICHSLKTCTDFYKSLKFANFTKTIKTIKKKNSEISNSFKNRTINNNNKQTKFFNSFHKSFIHKKLSSNPKYVEIESRICSTDRGQKFKNIIENDKNKNSILKHNLKKIFLTNDYKNQRNKGKKHILIKTENNDTEIAKKNLNLNIHSNIFLPFNLKRFRNHDYPDILCPKLEDFIEDIKMVRTVKFINNIKVEKQKTQNASVGLEIEKADIIMNSLSNSLKLLNSYNTSFTNYNKYLVNEIKKEKYILNNYVIDENIIKEQVELLEKKFDDLLLEFEILKNFKNLFIAIKSKTKIKYNNLSNKTFSEKYKEKIKQNFLFHKKKTNSLSSKELFNKRSSPRKKSRILRNIKQNEFSMILKNKKSSQSVKKEKLEKKEEKKSERKQKKHQTILNTKNNDNFKNEIKKLERFNSIQPSALNIKNNLENIINNQKKKKATKKVKFENYDVKRELKLIVNNLLKKIDKYNNIEYRIIYYKLLFDKENNSLDILMRNQLIKESINNLNFSKNYYSLLTSKYNLLKSQSNDYSLFILIYKKTNEMIDSIIDFKVKKYQNIINKLISLYDNNKLLIQYNNEKNRNKTLRAHLEEELINYLYKLFIVIEKLIHELIQGRNNYLSNHYYSEQIEKYENKMDNAKKIFNIRFKRSEELLRRKKINEDAIKKWNKIIYLPYKKVPIKYKILTNHPKKYIT